MPLEEKGFGDLLGSSAGASQPSFERRKVTRIAERIVVLLALIALMFFIVTAAMLTIFAQ